MFTITKIPPHCLRIIRVGEARRVRGSGKIVSLKAKNKGVATLKNKIKKYASIITFLFC